MSDAGKQGARPPAPCPLEARLPPMLGQFREEAAPSTLRMMTGMRSAPEEAVARVGDRGASTSRRPSCRGPPTAAIQAPNEPGTPTAAAPCRARVEAEATEGSRSPRFGATPWPQITFTVPPARRYRERCGLSPGPVLVRLEHMQSEVPSPPPHRRRCPLPESHADGGSEPVGRGDHAERTDDLRAGREHRSPRGYARCTPRSAHVSVLLPCRRLRQAPFRRRDFGRATRTGSGIDKIIIY